MRKAGFLRKRAALGVLLFIPIAQLSAQQSYRIGPPEGWVLVKTAETPADLPPEAVTGGYEMALIDAQDRVGNGSSVDRYRHIAYRLLDQSAVEEHSEVEISWDPTYESLTLHSAAVIRDGRVITQLQRNRIRVVNRESSRDYHIYDGRLTAILVLEDVRLGDVIDYSYTRRGSNPVFAGHYTAAIGLEQSVPVRAQRFRLLWPSQRSLYMQPHQTTVTPTITESGPFREYVWERHDLPPRVLDPNLPTWFDPYPWVQLSDFPDWRSVAAWGDTLFAAPGPVPAELAREVARIRADAPDQATRALAALRYVQEKIRYLGVEIGVNSHHPYPVATVLQRGYGDCKDKVQLLLAILRDLGIEGRPALVSTQYRDHLTGYHATSAEFDHVIVQLVVDGQTHWVDPTSTNEGGDLRSSSAQWGAGLVLGRDTDSLTLIPKEPAADGRTEINATFLLGDVDKPATLNVETDYRGSAATEVRATNGNTSIAQLSRDYLKFYASFYPAIQAEGVPVVEDNLSTNLLHVSEHYSIPDFWEKDAEGPGHTGTLSALELYSTMPSVASSNRSMPLAIAYPRSVRYSLTASMPEGWNIEDRTDSVRTPVLRFVRSIVVMGKTLKLTYDYETLADHVEPADVPAHMKELGRARDLIPYHVVPPVGGVDGKSWSTPGEINWPIVLLALGVLGLSIYGAVRVNQLPPPAWPFATPLPVVPRGDEPVGLSGWLVLVGIGVVLTPITMLVQLAGTASAYTASVWALRTTPGSAAYHPLWGSVLLFELTINLALIVAAVLVAKLFFQRRKWFPALFVIVAVIRIVVTVSDGVIATQIPGVTKTSTEIVTEGRNLLVLALWSLYMARSRRVRNTFTVV